MADVTRLAEEIREYALRFGLDFFDTYFEVLEYHHEQLAKAAEWLTSSEQWDILFTESHASDYASHFFLGQAGAEVHPGAVG